ncbi:MAG: hypothetical protein EBU84_07515 [Actinobacteria bacterium]|nr:hypothetical protein [Actinomycetota bacterium]
MFLIASPKNTTPKRPNIAFSAYQTVDIEGRPAVDVIIIHQDELRDETWVTTKRWNVANWGEQAPYYRLFRKWAMNLPEYLEQYHNPKKSVQSIVVEINDEQEESLEKFALWYQDYGIEKGIPNPLD